MTDWVITAVAGEMSRQHGEVTKRKYTSPSYSPFCPFLHLLWKNPVNQGNT